MFKVRSPLTNALATLIAALSLSSAFAEELSLCRSLLLDPTAQGARHVVRRSEAYLFWKYNLSPKTRSGLFIAGRGVDNRPQAFGPMNVLEPNQLDPVRRKVVEDILTEARSQRRIAAALPSEAFIQILLSAYRQEQTEFETLYHRALRLYDRGIEVGIWVITLRSGRTLVTPTFSNCRFDAYREVDCGPSLYAVLAKHSPRQIRSAEIFHFHPSDNFFPSRVDFDLVDGLARTHPEIDAFHIYAVSQQMQTSKVLIGHYGVTRTP